MPGFSNFQFDTLSFWLGFLAASLAWWLLQKIRPAVPRLVEQIRHQLRQNRRKSGDRVEGALRRDVLRRAQGMHLAAPLFALDDVLVQPLLIAPPPALVTPGQATPNTIANQVIPYLPDWPEVTAQYPVHQLHPAEALQNGARIAVIGQPGSGKTVLLASLASQAARQLALAGGLEQKLPVLVHIVDVPLDGGDWKADPLLPLIKTVSGQSSVLIQPQIPRSLRAAAADGRLLLLVDGLDEIHPRELAGAVAWLSALGAQFAGLSLLVAASPETMDGLSGAGFLPMTVAAWNVRAKELFLKRWAAAWQKYIQKPLSEKTNQQPVDTRILNFWLTSENENNSPIEWTLKVWALYAGDIRGAASADAIEAFLRRALHDRVPAAAITRVAALLLAQNKPALPYNEIERTLSELQLGSLAASPSPAGEKKSALNQLGKKNEPARSSGAQMLDALQEAGILAAHPGDLLRFSHLTLCAYHAAQCIEIDDAPLLTEKPHWALHLETARFAARTSLGQTLVQGITAGDDAPLYSGLFAAARWLKDAPANAPWRALVLRRLVTLIQQEDLPLGIRARVLGAFVSANDSSMPLLIKQLVASRNAAVRQIAALGCGALQNGKMLNDLFGLLADPTPDVRYTACLALAAFQQPAAQEALSAALMQGDEGLQQAAAEVMANQPGQGYETLKTALATDNFMVRRAAVLGMQHIREDWAVKLLEQTAVEDGQWVVRSAAALAVEGRQQTDPYLPAPLPSPSNAGWLITFASKQGTGVPADRFPMELLLDALQSGSQEEKLAALAYTRDIADERVLEHVHTILQSGDTTLREAALYTLWHKAASGQTISRVGMYKFSLS